MVSLVYDHTGLIISLLGIVLVLRSDILEKQSHRFFLWIFIILIAYALSDTISWITYEKVGREWMLASKISLFLASVFSGALIPLLAGFMLYSAGEEKAFRNRIFQMILAVFAVYLILLIYAQFSTAIYYYDESNTYHRGPWYPVLLVLPILMLILNIWLLWSKRNRLSKKNKAVFASCILLPVISMMIQMLFYGVNIIILGVSISAFIMLTNVINENRKQYYMQQEENVKLKTEILLSQIQPHFLFNTLGTISHLCTDAPEAKKAIGLFSRYLRGNIDVLSNEMLIPFDKEIDHARMYLELEKLRFGDSLQVSWDLQCTDFMIPSLTLQPLVENAVRYGVRGNADGCGTVRIQSRDRGDHYEISVFDSGPGFYPDHTQWSVERSHIGIDNVKERLRVVCNGEFRIQSIPRLGTTATIILPKEKKA